MNALQQAEQFLMNNQLQEALIAFQEILVEHPQLPAAHLGLGKIFLAISEFDKAIEHFSICCNSMTDSFEPLYLLAEAFEAVNSHQDVATLIQYILSKFPLEPQVQYRSAVYYSEIGDIDAAKKHINACIELAENTDKINILLLAYAWLLRIKLDKSIHTVATLKHLKQLKSKANIATQAQWIFEYACGDIYDTLKEHELAFKAWKNANKLQYQQRNVNIEDICMFLKEVKLQDVITSEKHANTAALANTITPIFIVGLARSGSTLLEQLIASHPQVQSLGEQPIISGHVANYFSQKYTMPYPQFLSKLTEQDKQQGALIYQQELLKRQINSSFVIDKLPANFQSISLIKAIFPQAKIIYLTRNIVDIAFSTFKHHFASNEPNFCDLSSIKQYYEACEDLITHWKQHYDILEISYEALVTKQKETLEKVMTYCGLAMQREQLEHHKHQQALPIKTLSALQARQAINESGISRSAPYIALLKKSGI